MDEKYFLKGKELKSISDYDFPALKKALKMDRKKIIEEISEAGLKGRGGAGFPTGLKWKFAYNEESDTKYFICNGDEGEPGTFKDRYLMEERPIKVLEGIMVGSYAVGADKGYIYIRGEYAKSIKTFNKLIKNAYKNGVLGENIFGSDFDFDLQLVKGAGAYVCGDETSLINSIEGKRGRSRIKPPYPIQKGLFDEPTVINNVETLTTAAEIINQGSEVYKAMGTEGSRGTKLVCLSGDINEPGLYEVEFGSMTIKEIIEEFGKGIKRNGELKFVIPGGISTSILTKEKTKIKYTYEDIEEAGSSLGSGALIVVSEGHELIDLLLNASRFYMDETCGTCFPCREGNRQVHHMLKEALGEGIDQDKTDLIKDIGETIRLASRCGLGQSSLNFIGSVINEYPNELLPGGVDNG
ncbi:MAG: NADH-ubiquinone oxidoreductase-F iron-sulfur binding region domain-containing protein [Halanaerobiales bacterium]